jgi:hypothetical protein
MKPNLEPERYPNPPQDDRNLNGLYTIQNEKRKGAFSTDYAKKGYDYFDVYTPEITSTYAQNFWHDMGSNPLPAHIVAKFKDRGIAIVGYEHDQVMVEPVGQPGANPEKDVSVPFNWVYNHHYMMWMTGEGSEMRYIELENKKLETLLGYPEYSHSYHFGMGKRVNASHTRLWRPVADGARKESLGVPAGVPIDHFFSEANGGESRKSFHGYPHGYAQVIANPEKWHITPMQIDTRNRECGITARDVLNSAKCPVGTTQERSLCKCWQGTRRAPEGVRERDLYAAIIRVAWVENRCSRVACPNCWFFLPSPDRTTGKSFYAGIEPKQARYSYCGALM